MENGYTMIRISVEIRDKLKKQAKKNHRSMIGELAYLLGSEHKRTRKSMVQRPIKEKVEEIVLKMRQLGYNSIHKSREIDTGFDRAGRALGLDYRTIKKYWDWFYENKIRPALEVRK